MVTSDVDCVYRLHFVILPRALRSTGYALPKEPICPAVIGWYLTAVIGAIRRNIPSAIGCLITLLVLSCVFIFAIRPCASLQCSVGVLLGKVSSTGSLSFIWPAILDLELERTSTR